MLSSMEELPFRHVSGTMGYCQILLMAALVFKLFLEITYTQKLKTRGHSPLPSLEHILLEVQDLILQASKDSGVMLINKASSTTTTTDLCLLKAGHLNSMLGVLKERTNGAESIQV